MPRNILIAAILTMVMSASAQTIWVDGTGDWFDGRNWSNGIPGSQSGRINNSGHALIFSPGAAGLVTLGFGAQDVGTLSVSGAGRMNGEVDVGAAGMGTLNIIDGGVVTSGRFVMASQPGSLANATVSGAGSKWTNNVVCFVGYDGTANLNILAGGKVSDSSAAIGEDFGSTGTVTIDGANSLWTHAGTLDVGGSGKGILTLTNGGKVFTNGSGGNFGSVIARNPGSESLVTITGAGSDWTNSGALAIGSGFAGSVGELRITEKGSASNSYALLGGPGGSGSATVDGQGSNWSNSGNLYVAAYAEGAGELIVSDGGKVSSLHGYVGPGLGTVSVSGEGSVWTNSGNLYLGNEAGTGEPLSLRIENKGLVSAGTINVYKTGLLQLEDASLEGTLTFFGGSIQALSNLTFSKDFALGSGGVQVQTNGCNVVFDGIISGSGGLTKSSVQPSGALVLTGQNTYVGPTTVNGGALLVNGSIASTVTINGSGTLGGSGTVGAVTVNSGGTVAPGNSAGRLSVQGNYNQTSNGTLAIELYGYVPGAEFDQLMVSGQAIIAGTLQVSLASGFKPNVNDTFAIISCGSENGNFSVINSPGFGVRSEVSPSGVVLTITSVFRSAGVRRSANDVIVRFEGALAGRTYRLERKVSLLMANWESPLLGTSDYTAARDGAGEITHLGGANEPTAFYRVVLLP